MRQQSSGAFRMYRYRMDPGDATRYEFFIAPLEKFASGVTVDSNGARDSRIGDLIIGVHDKEEEFVTLGILMPSGQGVYEVRKDSLRNPARHFVDYLMGHMPGVKNAYTVAAILLACSVLVDEPANLAKAAEKMLQAHTLLEE